MVNQVTVPGQNLQDYESQMSGHWYIWTEWNTSKMIVICLLNLHIFESEIFKKGKIFYCSQFLMQYRKL